MNPRLLALNKNSLYRKSNTSNAEGQFQDQLLRGSRQEHVLQEAKNASSIIYKKIVRRLLIQTVSKRARKQRETVNKSVQIRTPKVRSVLSIKDGLKRIGLDITSFPSDHLITAEKYILNTSLQTKQLKLEPVVLPGLPEGILQLTENLKGKERFGMYDSRKSSKYDAPCKPALSLKHSTNSIPASFLTESLKNSQKGSKYREFIFLVNYSNRVYLDLDNNQYPGHNLYYLGRGNNHKLIRSIMKGRFWWRETKVMESAQFVWTQNKIPELYLNQPSRKHPERQRQDVASQPKAKMGNPSSLLNILTEEELPSYMEVLHKESKSKRQVTYQQKSKLLRLKKVEVPSLSHNHLFNNGIIGNKKSLLFCLNNYRQIASCTISIPLSFHIKNHEDSQHQKFKIEYINAQSLSAPNVWIVKPGETTNRGNGIFCTSSATEIENLLLNKHESRTYIVQKYISNPLLYNKRKCDIRTYMLITMVNSKVKAYWYNIGYIRTSGKAFSLDNLSDNLVHLTNDAVQKHDKTYGKYQEGNKLTYSQMEKYLNSIGKTNGWSVIYNKMRSMAQKIVESSFLYLDRDRRDNFQLFGLDYLVDQDLQTYLLEVNSNPCLETGCPVLARIIPHLIENVFQICLDTHFPPPREFPLSQKHNLNKTPLEFNHFQLLFDEIRDGTVLTKLYQNRTNSGQTQETNHDINTTF